MLFNSVEFLLFLPLVLTAYYVLDFRYRWGVLLISSLLFYAYWKPIYLLLLVGSALVDFVVSKYLMEMFQKRKIGLCISLVVNLGVLFIYKYLGFFSTWVNDITLYFGGQTRVPVVNLILPMGISFYTFQTMSYTIDVYRRKISAESHFGYFLLYVCYFPQLVAGPIERASHLLPQLKTHKVFDYKLFRSGGQLILLGYIKKVVIADRLSVYVNQVYGSPEFFDIGSISLATLFFGVQIYCDFSGYSDIAIGVSRLLGIDLMKNFRSPYLSKSLTEFWSRWHISLSTWFKEYVYIPLGGNRTTRIRTGFNLLFTFLVSGLWHGANWNFIIWGALHGLILVLEKEINWSFVKILGWLKTMLVVFVGWVFFRVSSMNEVALITQKIASPSFTDIKDYLWSVKNAFSHFPESVSYNLFITTYKVNLSMTVFNFLIGIMFCIVLLGSEIIGLSTLKKRFDDQSVYVRYTTYLLVSLVIVVIGVWDKSEFIYFQF